MELLQLYSNDCILDVAVWSSVSRRDFVSRLTNNDQIGGRNSALNMTALLRAKLCLILNYNDQWMDCNKRTHTERRISQFGVPWSKKNKSIRSWDERTEDTDGITFFFQLSISTQYPHCIFFFLPPRISCWDRYRLARLQLLFDAEWWKHYDWKLLVLTAYRHILAGSSDVVLFRRAKLFNWFN